MPPNAVWFCPRLPVWPHREEMFGFCADTEAAHSLPPAEEVWEERPPPGDSAGALAVKPGTTRPLGVSRGGLATSTGGHTEPSAHLPEPQPGPRSPAPSASPPLCSQLAANTVPSGGPPPASQSGFSRLPPVLLRAWQRRREPCSGATALPGPGGLPALAGQGVALSAKQARVRNGK